MSQPCNHGPCFYFSRRYPVSHWTKSFRIHQFSEVQPRKVWHGTHQMISQKGYLLFEAPIINLQVQPLSADVKVSSSARGHRAFGLFPCGSQSVPGALHPCRQGLGPWSNGDMMTRWMKQNPASTWDVRNPFLWFGQAILTLTNRWLADFSSPDP